MTLRIQLSPELSEHIRTLVHETLNERKSRQKIEQLGMKIRAQLDQLSGPDRSTSGRKADLWTVPNNSRDSIFP